MAYSKTIWINESSPVIDAGNLNKIEVGIETLDLRVDAIDSTLITNGGIIAQNTSDIADVEDSVSTLASSLGELVVTRTGTFSGTWNPTLDSTFGVTGYLDYNWVISVNQTEASLSGSGTFYLSGVLNVDNKTLTMTSLKNSTAVPARYTLIGIKKTFSNSSVLNQ